MEKFCTKAYGDDYIRCIGFSSDEMYRAKRRDNRQMAFPLIEMNLTGTDCRRIVQEYGWPIPIKSSCFICQFQRPAEWRWLQLSHIELFDKAVALEARYWETHPHMKGRFGLLHGGSLADLAVGIQPRMFNLQENSCWDGACGH